MIEAHRFDSRRPGGVLDADDQWVRTWRCRLPWSGWLQPDVLSDALTPDEALGILRRAEPGREERIGRLLDRGYPACTTTPGWLGYSDEKLARLAREAVADGFTQIKLKVGASLEDDVRRLRTAREAVGDHIRIAVDANQRWDVQDAIDWMGALAPYRPYWIEELDLTGRLAVVTGARRHRPGRGARSPKPGRTTSASAPRWRSPAARWNRT